VRQKKNIIKSIHRFVSAELLSRLLFGIFLFPGLLLAAGLETTIQLIKPSIVGVGTVLPTRTPASQVLGTGFVVGDGLHVLTNDHVVSRVLESGANEYLAVFAGQGQQADTRKATKVAISPEYDLALLKISGPPLPALNLGDSKYVSEGEEIAFTGFPIGAVLGLYPVTHRGIVSAITPIVRPMDQSGQLSPEHIQRLRSPYEIFQLDATAYPGNSGSPMYLVESGDVVAIVNMVFVKETKESVIKDPSRISYAIPINYARSLLEKAGLK